MLWSKSEDSAVSWQEDAPERSATPTWERVDGDTVNERQQRNLKRPVFMWPETLRSLKPFTCKRYLWRISVCLHQCTYSSRDSPGCHSSGIFYVIFFKIKTEWIFRWPENQRDLPVWTPSAGITSTLTGLAFKTTNKQINKQGLWIKLRSSYVQGKHSPTEAPKPRKTAPQSHKGSDVCKWLLLLRM